MSDWLRACLVAAVGLAMAGCGGGYQPKEGVIVKGTVLKGAQPLQVPRRDIGLGSVEVQLVPTGPLAASVGLETALADEQGAFEFRGAGRGVMPGKYKLAVYQHDNGLASDGLKGAFSDANTPIEVEIPEDKVGDTQDLGVLELNDQVKR